MNLQEVVQTLIDGGLSEASIAQQIGVSQPTVHRIKNGANTAYSIGKRLEKLHREVKDRMDSGSGRACRSHDRGMLVFKAGETRLR